MLALKTLFRSLVFVACAMFFVCYVVEGLAGVDWSKFSLFNRIVWHSEIFTSMTVAVIFMSLRSKNYISFSGALLRLVIIVFFLGIIRYALTGREFPEVYNSQFSLASYVIFLNYCLFGFVWWGFVLPLQYKEKIEEKMSQPIQF